MSFYFFTAKGWKQRYQSNTENISLQVDHTSPQIFSANQYFKFSSDVLFEEKPQGKSIAALLHAFLTNMLNRFFEAGKD